jgi:hypothetical protein
VKTHLVIALDFDDTFTADPDFWLDFINLATRHQHRVICVSSRPHSTAHINHLSLSLPSHVEIFLCGDVPKEEYMRHTKYEKVDIWIDDKPEFIPRNVIRIE